MTQDEIHMTEALGLARQALRRGEFPVGCVVVQGGAVLASGSRRGTAQGLADELDHAEMLALRELENVAGPADRKRATLYCTLEPCLMCFGAILISGIGRVVYAYEDVMGGGTRVDRSGLPPLYKDRVISVRAHVLREESVRIFKSFFQNPANGYLRGTLLADYTLRR